MSNTLLNNTIQSTARMILILLAQNSDGLTRPQLMDKLCTAGKLQDISPELKDRATEFFTVVLDGGIEQSFMDDNNGIIKLTSAGVHFLLGLSLQEVIQTGAAPAPSEFPFPEPPPSPSSDEQSFGA